MALLEHLIGLPHTGAIAEVELKPPALGASDHPEKFVGSVFFHLDIPSKAKFNIKTFTLGSPRIPKSRPSV
jgi:hypothetical protein